MEQFLPMYKILGVGQDRIDDIASVMLSWKAEDDLFGGELVQVEVIRSVEPWT